MKEEIQKETRHIMINSAQLKHYADNTIKTAKYNWFTFLPLAVIYQFNNYFNIFFLVTAIILAIKEISPMDPGTAIAPFIFVISVSVIREGIEDWKKTNYDKTYNNSITTKILFENNKEEKIKWSDVRVGDVLKIHKNESIPSDLLVIKSSISSGFCYMETTNLDGESALKPREALPLFNTIFKEHRVNEDLKIQNIKGELEVDQPNFNIYTVNGSVTLTDSETSKNIPKVFFDVNNVLLRGTTLKNVDYAIGLVIYTGIDTKLMKNIQTFSLKSSSIEKTVNKVIIVVIIIVFSICVGCTMFGMIFMGGNVPNHQEGLRRSEYIYYANSENYPYTLEFFKLFGAFFIIFNNIIPISLTITFEIAKGIQTYIMAKDTQMFNEKEDEKFKIFSLKLQEDLGNVKYIFTDKTGTLTKNEMIFRACSIYSKLFFDQDQNGCEISEDMINVKRDANKGKKSIFSPLFNLNSVINAMNCDMPIELENIHESKFKSTSDSIIEFFLNIALNHNVLTETDQDTNQIIYQGANPDEVALVTAAKEIGVEFVKREGTVITIKINDDMSLYEVLHKFEFTSDRARSSIIVRDLKDDKIKLFIKGSDDKILKISDYFSKTNLDDITKEHLDRFAKSGLRTLCYAVKFIDEEDYLEWNKNYSDVKSQFLSNKEKKLDLDNQICKIESDCILLGVSGLEDMLQDEARDTITQLIEAGIQMWMVTGDKLDTAESIGYSSKFFDEDTEVFKIRSASQKSDILANMNRIMSEIENMEKHLNMTKLERKKKKKKADAKEIEMVNLKRRNYTDNDDVGLHNNIKERTTFEDNLINIITIGDSANVLTPRMENKTLIKLKSNLPHIKHFQNKNKAHKHYQNQYNYTDECYNDRVISEQIEDYNQTETPSQMDDVSVFKFMVDKNFFDESVMNKNEFAHTFVNRILQYANSNNFGKNKNNQKIIDREPNYENNTVLSPSKNHILNGEKETPRDVILNNLKEFQDEDGVCEVIKTLESDAIEEIDLSNLYDHYLNELNRMKERKKSVRNILKFTNFDFPNFRKKKTEDEEHDMKDINMLNFGLVIEGNAITLCLDDELKATFWRLIKKSRSIICCRCTPIQKSDIVNFVKSKSGEVCLSIGDGGNDVNMIKAANVGIGIFGKEGYQAAFNADYAISQFKYLKRLLFYHGRYSMVRNSYFIYFFFYKSLIFNVPNLWFAFFSGFSGTLLWDNLYFICYTSILSTVPPVIIMVFEEDIDITFEGDPNKEILINLVPDIYKEYRESSPFNSLKFFIIFLLGIVHSAIIYFFPLFVFRYGSQDQTGRAHTLWDQSLLGVLTVMIVQYYIIFQDTFLYSTPVIIAHTIQIVHNFAFFILYGLFGNDQLGAYTFDIISNLQFWFVLIITLAIDLIFVILSRKVEILIADNIINNLRNRKYEYDYTKKIYMKKLEHMSKCTRSLAKFKKIYKEIDKYEADTYADRKMKDFVEMYLKNKKIKSNSNSPNSKARPYSRRENRSKTAEKFNEKLKTFNIRLRQMKKRHSTKNFRTTNNFNYNINLNINVIKKNNDSSNDSQYDIPGRDNIYKEGNSINDLNNFVISSENIDSRVCVNAFTNDIDIIKDEEYKNPQLYIKQTPGHFELDNNVHMIDNYETKIIFFDEKGEDILTKSPNKDMEE